MNLERGIGYQFTEGGQNQKNKLMDSLEKPEEKIDKLEEIMVDLETIIEIEEPETQKQAIQVFIEKRLEELEKEVSEKQSILSLVGNKAEDQFIHPETEIKRNWMFDGFNVNDPEIYTVLLENFGKFYKHWNKPNPRSIIGHSIIYALSEYFGNHFSVENTNARNCEFYKDHTTTDSRTVDLAELKEKSLAVCAEKATVAHNYLKFLGMDSYVIFSDNCKLGDSNDGHAYIIFSTKNGKFIFDPTNPILIEDSEGKINSVNPALYKIPEEDFNHLLNRDNNQITVQHIDQKLDNGKYIPKEPQARVYG